MSSRGWKSESIAIGRFAGDESFTERTIAIGRTAGNKNQSQFAIALGDEAGNANQGEYSIAIGAQAGTKEQVANSIIINAKDTQLESTEAGLYIDPVRIQATGSNLVTYHKDTKEISTSFPELPKYATDALATADYIRINTVEVVPAPATPLVPPTKPAEGTMYFDTTKKKIKVWVGTKWLAIPDADDMKKLGVIL